MASFLVALCMATPFAARPLCTIRDPGAWSVEIPTFPRSRASPLLFSGSPGPGVDGPGASVLWAESSKKRLSRLFDLKSLAGLGLQGLGGLEVGDVGRGTWAWAGLLSAHSSNNDNIHLVSSGSVRNRLTND